MKGEDGKIRNEILKLLIPHLVDYDRAQNQFFWSIIELFKIDDLQTLRHFIDAKILNNSPLSMGKSLSYVMSKKHGHPITDDYLAMLKLLIPVAETNIPYHYKSPLMLAPNVQILRLLITHGASIDFQNEDEGQTALMINNHDPEITLELTSMDCNLHVIDKKGRTALDYLAEIPAQASNTRYVALRYLEYIYLLFHDSPIAKLEKFARKSMSSTSNLLFLIKPHHLKALYLVDKSMAEVVECDCGCCHFHFLVYFVTRDFKEKLSGLISVLASGCELEVAKVGGGGQVEKWKGGVLSANEVELVKEQKKIAEEFYEFVTKGSMGTKLNMLCKKLVGVRDNESGFEEKVDMFLKSMK